MHPVWPSASSAQQLAVWQFPCRRGEAQNPRPAGKLRPGGKASTRAAAAKTRLQMRRKYPRLQQTSGDCARVSRGSGEAPLLLEGSAHASPRAGQKPAPGLHDGDRHSLANFGNEEQESPCMAAACCMELHGDLMMLDIWPPLLHRSSRTPPPAGPAVSG
ncbi:hypothetical protein WJX73_005562 [Symbiochloris irregularis]|uniref:Uncharacterized protein n=1 Tax=Symbiochloris irregularis TaxID=706552 RepID=A0AAW1NVY1_9CHLO